MHLRAQLNCGMKLLCVFPRFAANAAVGSFPAKVVGQHRNYNGKHNIWAWLGGFCSILISLCFELDCLISCDCDLWGKIEGIFWKSCDPCALVVHVLIVVRRLAHKFLAANELWELSANPFSSQHDSCMVCQQSTLQVQNVDWRQNGNALNRGAKYGIDWNLHFVIRSLLFMKD